MPGRRASAIILAEAPQTIPEPRSWRFLLADFFPRMWPRFALRCVAFFPDPVNLNRFAIPLCVLTFAICAFRKRKLSKNRSEHLSEDDGGISTPATENCEGSEIEGRGQENPSLSPPGCKPPSSREFLDPGSSILRSFAPTTDTRQTPFHGTRSAASCRL